MGDWVAALDSLGDELDPCPPGWLQHCRPGARRRWNVSRQRGAGTYAVQGGIRHFRALLFSFHVPCGTAQWGHSGNVHGIRLRAVQHAFFRILPSALAQQRLAGAGARGNSHPYLGCACLDKTCLGFAYNSGTSACLRFSSDCQLHSANVLYSPPTGSGGALLAGVFCCVCRVLVARNSYSNLERLLCLCDCRHRLDRRWSISLSRASRQRSGRTFVCTR